MATLGLDAVMVVAEDSEMPSSAPAALLHEANSVTGHCAEEGSVALPAKACKKGREEGWVGEGGEMCVCGGGMRHGSEEAGLHFHDCAGMHGTAPMLTLAPPPHPTPPPRTDGRPEAGRQA